MRPRVTVITLVLALSLGSGSSVGAVAKIGAACPKIGLATDSLICRKVYGELKWQSRKLRQSIHFSAPNRILNTVRRVPIAFSASSRLTVAAVSKTPKTCSIAHGSKTILLSGEIGVCRISLTQSGNTKYSPAKPILLQISIVAANSISFDLPAIIALTRGTLRLTATSLSGTPVFFLSSSSAVCSVSDSILTLISGGECVVSAMQPATEFYEAPTPVRRTMEVSLSRTTSDQPDLTTGFQVKAIYVVPSDGEDNSYDISGRISEILREGNDFLGEELGRTLPIDLTVSGYDISFLKSSKPASYFMTSPDGIAQLLTETKFLDLPSQNRKEFVFFVDVPVVKAQQVCGYSSTPGISVVLAIGQGKCTSPTAFFRSFASTTWIHEVLHNFGVRHVPDPCDLMASGDPIDGPLCSNGRRETMDRQHVFYVNSDNYGNDILKLRVWQGQTENTSLKANCQRDPAPRSDGFHYAYCSTGTRVIGALQACWSSIYSVVLEEFSDGAWRSLGEGDFDAHFWRGELPGWSCADPRFVTPWKLVTVDVPGIRHYRWKVNGDIVEEMNIIWTK